MEWWYVHVSSGSASPYVRLTLGSSCCSMAMPDCSDGSSARLLLPPCCADCPTPNGPPPRLSSPLPPAPAREEGKVGGCGPRPDSGACLCAGRGGGACCCGRCCCAILLLPPLVGSPPSCPNPPPPPPPSSMPPMSSFANEYLDALDLP